MSKQTTGRLLTSEKPMRVTTDSFLVDRAFAALPWSWRWSMAGLAALWLLLSLAVVLGVAGGASPWTPSIDVLRVFLPGIVTVYLLAAVRWLARTREKVALALRPTLKIDDTTFLAVVRRACQSSPAREVVSVVLGIAVLVAVVGLPGRGSQPDWLGLYYYAGMVVLFGVVGWSIYAVSVISRMTSRLLDQPIEVDVFDVTPFEPIGTQSLYLALAFVVAIVLALPSSPATAADCRPRRS